MAIKISAPVIEGCDDDGSSYKARIIREGDWCAIRRVLRAADKWYTTPLAAASTKANLDHDLMAAMFALNRRTGK